jgi:hypothetical protein
MEVGDIAKTLHEANLLLANDTVPLSHEETSYGQVGTNVLETFTATSTTRTRLPIPEKLSRKN